MSHWMIDIETLSTRSNAIILSIGLAEFDIHNGDVLYSTELRPDCYEQEDMGRTVSLDTLDWWLNKDCKTVSQCIHNVTRVKACLDSIDFHIDKLDYVWSKGPNFDIRILEDLYAMCGRNVPWDFRKCLDVRTMEFMAKCSNDIDLPEIDSSLAHIAVHDAIHQAGVVSLVFNGL